jgi:hypothetical protein
LEIEMTCEQCGSVGLPTIGKQRRWPDRVADRARKLRWAGRYEIFTQRQEDVKSAMRRRKKGKLKSGKGGKGGTVKSRKQAIAIGLSEARKKGKKVPKRRASGKKSSK